MKLNTFSPNDYTILNRNVLRQRNCPSNTLQNNARSSLSSLFIYPCIIWLLLCSLVGSEVLSFLKTSWWESCRGCGCSKNVGFCGHQHKHVLHAVMGMNVAGPQEHVPAPLGSKVINRLVKAVGTKVCLLNFHEETKLALWPCFYFYLLCSLIPSWTKDSIHVRVFLIGWKQPQLAFPLSWGRCEEQMIRVTAVAGDCCKEEKGLRGGGSPEAALWLSIDPTGFVTTISVLLLEAIQAYSHTVGYS